MQFDHIINAISTESLLCDDTEWLHMKKNTTLGFWWTFSLFSNPCGIRDLIVRDISSSGNTCMWRDTNIIIFVSFLSLFLPSPYFFFFLEWGQKRIASQAFFSMPMFEVWTSPVAFSRNSFVQRILPVLKEERKAHFLFIKIKMQLTLILRFMCKMWKQTQNFLLSHQSQVTDVKG